MTDIRPEISKKNKYWISRHRYYELKHFCMQYREWLAEVNSYSGYASADISRIGGSGKEWSKPTEFAAEKITDLTKCLCMVDDAAKATDEVIGDYILTGVTTGMSYDTLNARCTIPCCKDIYYDLYRKFFFILSEKRK